MLHLGNKNKKLSFVLYFARFALSLNKIGFISEIKTKKLSFVLYFARFALSLQMYYS